MTAATTTRRPKKRTRVKRVKRKENTEGGSDVEVDMDEEEYE
jgi:hypothetical protein